MKEAIVAMLLLGCNCDGSSCEYIQTMSSEWASMESCRAALDAQPEISIQSYPLVVSDCFAEPAGADEPRSTRPAQAPVAASGEQNSGGIASMLAAAAGRAGRVASRGYGAAASEITMLRDRTAAIIGNMFDTAGTSSGR